MSHAPPKIPPAPQGHNRIPRRAEIADATIDTIKRGRGFKADLLLVDVGQGPLVVKDFAGRGGLGRLLGRLQTGRELRAYRYLGPLEGLPRLVGRVDAHALALEWIDGELLATAESRVRDGRTHVARLRAVIDRLHERGLAHLDLRSNKNVLLGRDGAIWVLDLASAVWFARDGMLRRRLLPRLQAIDLSGWLKWKLVLEAGPLDAEERALLRSAERASRLWPFNPKRRDRGEAGGKR